MGVEPNSRGVNWCKGNECAMLFWGGCAFFSFLLLQVLCLSGRLAARKLMLKSVEFCVYNGRFTREMSK